MIPSHSHLNARHSHTTQACTHQSTDKHCRIYQKTDLGIKLQLTFISYKSFSDYTVAGVDKNVNSPLPR